MEEVQRLAAVLTTLKEQTSDIKKMIGELFAHLSEEHQNEVLEELLKNRCRKCLAHDPNGEFWCCYDSRGG